MPEYIPSPLEWVARQVKEYEESNGTMSTTLRDLPVIIMTNIGRKTGGVSRPIDWPPPGWVGASLFFDFSVL